MSTKNTYVCQICDRSFETLTGLGNHIKCHKIKLKEYYDAFHKKVNEGFCPCGKVTSFRGLGKRYAEYCSQSCIGSSNKVKNKRKETSRRNWGTDNPLSVPAIYEKSKQTMLIKWGARHSAQVPELQEKQQKSAHKQKDFVMPSGDIRKVQGNEPQALQMLLDIGFTEDELITGSKNVPRVSYNYEKKDHYYFPDIWIPTINTLVEVKSEWTMNKHLKRNHAKHKFSELSGMDHHFLIID